MNDLLRGRAARSAHQPHKLKVASSNLAPASTFLTAEQLASARTLARLYEEDGRSATAAAINTLVFEIENLHEAVKGSLEEVRQVIAEKSLAKLKASTLLIVAEKIAPVLDQEIENRKTGCNRVDWALLQSLSDELHAALKLVRA